MNVSNLYSERTNLRILLTSLIVAVIGLVLLYITDNSQWFSTHLGIKSFISNVGGLLVASVAMAILWDLIAKRAFLEEFVANAKLANEVKNAGILAIPNDIHHDIDWSQLFRRANEIDIFFAYGRTWRRIRAADLHEVSKRSNVQVRIILPDPDNETLMTALSARFEITTDEIKYLIKEATKDFIETFNGTNTKLSIWYHSATPVFSFYRINHIAILSLYKHIRKREYTPPTFVAEQGGTIYEFVMRELDAFIKQPSDNLIRQIFPER